MPVRAVDTRLNGKIMRHQSRKKERPASRHSWAEADLFWMIHRLTAAELVGDEVGYPPSNSSPSFLLGCLTRDRLFAKVDHQVVEGHVVQ